MSTKVTLSHSDDYHLYAECFDNDNVYLRLDPGALSEFQTDGQNRAVSVTVGIPIKIWREIVSGWSESQWAKNPERDNEPIELGDLGWIKDVYPAIVPGVWIPAEDAVKSWEARDPDSVWWVLTGTHPFKTRGLLLDDPDKFDPVRGGTLVIEGDWVYYVADTGDQAIHTCPDWDGLEVAQAVWSEKGRRFHWDRHAIPLLWTPAEAVVEAFEARSLPLAQWAWVRPDALGGIGDHGRVEGPITDTVNPEAGEWWVYLGEDGDLDYQWDGLQAALDAWAKYGWVSLADLSSVNPPDPDIDPPDESFPDPVADATDDWHSVDPYTYTPLPGTVPGWSFHDGGFALDFGPPKPRMVWWTVKPLSSARFSKNPEVTLAYRDPTNGQRVVVPSCDPHPENIARAMGWEAVCADDPEDNTDPAKSGKETA